MCVPVESSGVAAWHPHSHPWRDQTCPVVRLIAPSPHPSEIWHILQLLCTFPGYSTFRASCKTTQFALRRTAARQHKNMYPPPPQECGDLSPPFPNKAVTNPSADSRKSLLAPSAFNGDKPSRLFGASPQQEGLAPPPPPGHNQVSTAQGTRRKEHIAEGNTGEGERRLAHANVGMAIPAHQA